MKPKRKRQAKIRRQHKEISVKSGMPPESLVHVGQVYLEKTLLELITFNTDSYSREAMVDIAELDKKEKFRFTWLKVNGLHDVSTIESIGKKLNISQLLLEDVLNTSHRPKLEEHGDFLFLTLRLFNLRDYELESEQISLILGQDILVSFQETERPLFEPVVARLSTSTGKIRSRGLDYLLYNLVDVIVDHYYSILEKTGDQLEELEDVLFDNPDKTLMEKNQQIRKNIFTIRKALLPTQEAMNTLLKAEPELIDPEDLPYFSDINDHVNQCLDFIDVYRELSAEIKETYLSNLSYRMNQVMKLLTIITTIFIPLSFIAGIYGMNFKYMPELEWRSGYYLVLGLMLTLLLGMLVYFRIRKWI